MKIIVCLKYIVKEENIKFDNNGNIIRENVEFKINSFDEYALENALILKDRHNFEIITITMGPLQTIDLIRYSISKGADNGFVISDPLLKGCDAFITALVLSKAINKIVNDRFMVFCGLKSEDGETSIVPPQIAERLSIPFIPLAIEIELNQSNAIITSQTKNEKIKYLSQIPCVISFDISKTKPRLPSLKNTIKAKRFNPKIFSLKDLELQFNAIEKSPTQVISYKKIEDNIEKNFKLIDIRNKYEVENIKKIIYE